MPTSRRQRRLMANPTPRLIAWYGAGTLALSDTNAVSAWEDTTRLSTGVSQATGANQPTYKNNGTDNINGLPVVTFDGTNDVLGSVIPVQLKYSFTLFLVFRPDTSVNGRGMVTMKSTLSSRGMSLQISGTGLAYYENGTALYNAFNAGYLTNGVPALITIRKQRTETRTYVNGVLKRTDASPPLMTDPNPGSSFFLGAGSNGSAEFFNKDIAEVRVYDGAMSDAQRQAEELRLNTKYALF